MTIFANFPNLIFIGNKAKGHISKRVFQENKTRQIFRKMSISYPLIRTRGVLATPMIIFDNFHTSFEMNQEEHLLN